jgi:hypothetical protein
MLHLGTVPRMLQCLDMGKPPTKGAKDWIPACAGMTEEGGSTRRGRSGFPSPNRHLARTPLVLNKHTREVPRMVQCLDMGKPPTKGGDMEKDMTLAATYSSNGLPH